mgnify:CR=1 FL=1
MSTSSLDASVYPDTFHNHMSSIRTYAITVEDAISTNFMHDRDCVLDTARIIFTDTAATLGLGYLTPREQGGMDAYTTVASTDLTVLTNTIDMDITSGDPLIQSFTFLETAAAAYGNLKCVDTAEASDVTITIIDTAGKSVIYKGIDTGGDAAGTVQADGSVAYIEHGTEATCAASLAVAINHVNGHGTTITALVHSTDEISLTQDVAGRAGNTVIVASDVATIKVDNNFAGGRNAGEPGFVPEGSILFVFDSETNIAANQEGHVSFRYRDRFA